MIKKLLTFLSIFVIFMTCNGQQSSIIIDENKQGGLYEGYENGTSLKFYNRDETMKVDTTAYISFAHFNSIKIVKPPFDGMFAIAFDLDSLGTKKFKEMTKRNLRKQIYFVLDNEIMAAPIISDVISNGQIQMTLTDRKGIELIVEYFQN